MFLSHTPTSSLPSPLVAPFFLFTSPLTSHASLCSSPASFILYLPSSSPWISLYLHLLFSSYTTFQPLILSNPLAPPFSSPHPPFRSTSTPSIFFLFLFFNPYPVAAQLSGHPEPLHLPTTSAALLCPTVPISPEGWASAAHSMQASSGVPGTSRAPPIPAGPHPRRYRMATARPGGHTAPRAFSASSHPSLYAGEWKLTPHFTTQFLCFKQKGKPGSAFVFGSSTRKVCWPFSHVWSTQVRLWSI